MVVSGTSVISHIQLHVLPFGIVAKAVFHDFTLVVRISHKYVKINSMPCLKNTMFMYLYLLQHSGKGGKKTMAIKKHERVSL